MNRKSVAKIGLVILALAAVVLFFKTGLSQYLTLNELKSRHADLSRLYQNHVPEFLFGYFVLYVAVTALSIPGAAVLTLGAGAIFGFWIGTGLVSLASTIGATLAFLASRFLFRDVIRARFGQRLEKIDQGLAKEGGFYLFTLRLIPVFPFFVINLVMGLTSIKTATFFFVSQIGMLAGTAAFVNAGTQLSEIDSLKGILSSRLLLAFAIIGVLPLVSKSIIGFIRSRRMLWKHKPSRAFDYNVVVIGAGSGGLVSAYIAAAVKAKVALIEKHKMGGDCLNTGCVPSKALIRSAKVFSLMKRAREFGFEPVSPRVDFQKVMERVQCVIKEIEPHDSVERYSELGVDCIQGEAKILNPYEVRVGDRVLTTRSIIIATGARPFVPPIPGLDQVGALTSDNLWELKELPKRLVILGGGPIGCELAQSFARFGSQVSIVEMSDHLMSREDEDVSTHVESVFAREGIKILTRHKARGVEGTASGKTLVCDGPSGETRVEFDEILVALGRRANVTGFGLEELGVEISKRGTIETDEFLRTNYPNVYACGDVAGPYQFTHTAAHQAWYASVNSLFSPLKKYSVDYRVIPWCTFTDPEVARVGLNEKEAKGKGIPYCVSTYGIDDLDRAITEGHAHGFIKVLTKPGKDEIIGATIVGEHAGDIIVEYVAAMKHGFGLNKILSTIHIYPTHGEANKYVAGVWKRNSAPATALRWLEKFHAWRR